MVCRLNRLKWRCKEDTVEQVKYRDGYKYQMAETYTVNLLRYVPGVEADVPIRTQFIQLDDHYQLTIYSGYCWDGASGPTIDTKDSMRGSLVHDALYQLIREEHLPADWKHVADVVFHQICLEDGMSKWRAWLWFKAVDQFAHFAADPRNCKKVITAPHE
jgi:hypothetical protein